MSTDLSFNQDCVDPFDVDNPNIWIKIEHLGRYLFAADFLKRYCPSQVADIACGTGYGVRELSRVADIVVGVDQSPTVLEKARRSLEGKAWQKNGNINFYEQDLESLPWSKIVNHSPFDAIVSFETLEHLIEPELVLNQFAQMLKEKGLLICSVPNILYDPSDAVGLPANPYHKQFFSFSAFRRLLEKQGFQVLHRLGQTSPNILFKRETKLLRYKTITERLGDFPAVHSPDLVRHLSYLLAYPTVEDVDGSYSLIVVAQKA